MRAMKVLHSGTLVASSGGPAMSTYLTIKGLRQLGVDTQIIRIKPLDGEILRGDDVPMHIIESTPRTALGYAHSYKRDVIKAGEFDIYHAQGVWLWNTYAMVDAARKLGKPYLITPRGMLYPQDIAKSNSYIKKLSLRWRLLDDLNQAACVHVTCKEEMRHCRNLGVTAPIAIIPNPVEIIDFIYKKQDDVRRVGFLGRLSPRKNVEGLIRAFADLGSNAKNAELLVIGGGEKSYERFLRNEVERLQLKNVRFAGFLSNAEKDLAIASCSVLAMPSEFENLGNVVLEGLVRGIPCIATQGSPWEELNTHHCGWWVPYCQEEITHALRLAINSTNNELKIMGQNGRKLMEDLYSLEAIAQKMKNLYEWILKKEDKPDFVYTL